MNQEEYLEELQNIITKSTNLCCLQLKREGKPINSELAVLNYLAEKYIRYKKDLRLFRRIKCV